MKYEDGIDDGKNKARNKIIIDLINKLTGQNNKGYKIDNFDNISINSAQYTEAIEDIIENSIYFSNESTNKLLFFKSKKECIDDNSVQYYVNTVQRLLELYGIIFSRGKRSHIGGKSVCSHSLSIDEEIKSILEFKYGISDEVGEYPSIFKRV